MLNVMQWILWIEKDSRQGGVAIRRGVREQENRRPGFAYPPSLLGFAGLCHSEKLPPSLKLRRDKLEEFSFDGLGNLGYKKDSV